MYSALELWSVLNFMLEPVEKPLGRARRGGGCCCAFMAALQRLLASHNGRVERIKARNDVSVIMRL